MCTLENLGANASKSVSESAKLNPIKIQAQNCTCISTEFPDCENLVLVLKFIFNYEMEHHFRRAISYVFTLFNEV